MFLCDLVNVYMKFEMKCDSQCHSEKSVYSSGYRLCTMFYLVCWHRDILKKKIAGNGFVGGEAWFAPDGGNLGLSP